MKLRALAVVAVATVLASATACGSSTNGSGNHSTGAPAPTGGGSQAAPTGGGSSGGGGQGVGVSSPAPGGSSGGSAQFCTNLKNADEKLAQLGSAGDSPDSLKAAISTDISAYQSLAAGAPAEIQPSVNGIVKDLQDLESLVSGGGAPDPSKVSGIESKLGTDTENLAKYVGLHCGSN